MKLITLDQVSIGIRQIPDVSPILLIGNFDGIHKGHQSLIKYAKDIAKQCNSSLAVMSFYPHPKYFIQKGCPPFSIISEELKIKLLEQYGVDYFYNVEFNSFTADTSAKNFIENFLYKTIKPSHVIVGENFRFGRQRSGDINLLKKLGLQYSMNINTANLIKDKHSIISSSLIRNNLKDGNIQKANSLLGWDWFISLTIKEINISKNNICMITKPIDKNIIYIKDGKYNISIKSAQNTIKGIFSLHRAKNSITVLLQKGKYADMYVVEDVIHLYPENMCCINKEKDGILHE